MTTTHKMTQRELMAAYYAWRKQLQLAAWDYAAPALEFPPAAIYAIGPLTTAAPAAAEPAKYLN